MMLVLLISFVINSTFQNDSFRIFTKSGIETDFREVVRKAANADVILFGELHDDSVSHALELELIKELKASGRTLKIGAEMFESDDQLPLNEYLTDLIAFKHIKPEIKLWPNFETDYQPILEFSKNNEIPFIATNCPRRYASFVAYNGLDSLSKLPKGAFQFLPPLPIDTNFSLPGYKNMRAMQHGHGNLLYLAEAQALKDACMAYNIISNHNKKDLFVHFNGAYHSNNFEGIYWYLQKQKNKLKVMTISVVEQKDISKLSEENLNIADFIITVPETRSKTY